MTHDQWLNHGNPAYYEPEKETLIEDLICDTESLIKEYEVLGLDSDEVVEIIKETL